MASEASEAVAAMILERQRARTSTHARQTTARAEIREWLARRRKAGLKVRHETKLARSRKPGMLL